MKASTVLLLPGDVVGPVIRDVGVALAMRPGADAVRQVLNAQMGKAGAPMRDGDATTGTPHNAYAA